MVEMYPEQLFLESIIKTLATKPDQVRIARKTDEMGILYTVSVSEDDVAKIIGKEGATAKAIRCLLKIVAHDNNVRAAMKIDAPTIVKN